MESFLWAKSRLRARPRPAGMGHEEIPGNPRSGSESIVKAIAQLDEHFARLEKVRAAEGEAVVEQHAAIGDGDGLQIDGEALAETLGEREFPAVDASTFNGDGNENLRIVEIVVVEEVAGSSEKVVGV